MLLEKNKNQYSCIFKENNCKYEIEIKDGKLFKIYIRYFNGFDWIEQEYEPYEKAEVLEKLYNINIEEYCELLQKLDKSESYYLVGVRRVQYKKKIIEKSLRHINNFLSNEEVKV